MARYAAVGCFRRRRYVALTSLFNKGSSRSLLHVYDRQEATSRHFKHLSPAAYALFITRCSARLA
jgi:hypothetical protein